MHYVLFHTFKVFRLLLTASTLYNAHPNPIFAHT